MWIRKRWWTNSASAWGWRYDLWAQERRLELVFDKTLDGVHKRLRKVGKRDRKALRREFQGWFSNDWNDLDISLVGALQGMGRRRVMLKLFFGVLLGYLLFTNPQARQVTADLLRAGGDAIAPADDSKTLRERFTDLIGGN